MTIVWYAGWLPVVMHLVILYLCYRIMHVRMRWWLWKVNWLAVTLATLVYSALRIMHQLEALGVITVSEHVLITLATLGSICLLIMAANSYYIFRRLRQPLPKVPLDSVP